MTDPAPSLARQVAVRGAVIVVLTLALVGIGTGATLHVGQQRALDRLLLAAAQGDAHGPVGGEWEVEHSSAQVRTWRVLPGDGSVPAALAEAARRGRGPVYAEVSGHRLVLLAAEREGREQRHQEQGERDEHDDDDHRSEARDTLLVAAAAPTVTLRASIGSFAAVYSVVAILAAVAAGSALWGSVRTDFRALDRSRREAEDVVALGQGKRLTEDGPIEIRALLVSLNAVLDRLDAAYAAQGRFTAEAAHELRTPVAAMLGELDVALRHPRSADEYRLVLGSAREEVQRLARLVSGLTALARLDAGQAEGAREPIRAEELARSAAATEQQRLDAAGCALELQVDADPELVGHRALLEVALSNLLRNAATHAPGSPVRLRVDSEGDRAVFEVDDGGPGVAPDHREALFDRFVRGGAARRDDHEGLGLGLPIAQQVARRHGGDCTLGESPTGGLRARLTVRLDVRDDS